MLALYDPERILASMNERQEQVTKCAICMKKLHGDTYLICDFAVLDADGTRATDHVGHTACFECVQSEEYIGVKGRCKACLCELGTACRSGARKAGVAKVPPIKNRLATELVEVMRNTERDMQQAKENAELRRIQEGNDRRSTEVLNARERKAEREAIAAEAEREREVAEAKADAEREVAEAKADAEREVAETRATAEREIEAAKRELAEAKAEQKRSAGKKSKTPPDVLERRRETARRARDVKRAKLMHLEEMQATLQASEHEVKRLQATCRRHAARESVLWDLLREATAESEWEALERTVAGVVEADYDSDDEAEATESEDEAEATEPEDDALVVD